MHNRAITIDAITRNHLEELEERIKNEVNQNGSHILLVVDKTFREETTGERIYNVSVYFNFQPITPDEFEAIDRVAMQYIRKIKKLI